MIELSQIATNGLLAQVLANDPLVQPYNDVEGVSLSYDEDLVRYAVMFAACETPPHWQGTIEFSRKVAMLLGTLGRRWERGHYGEPYEEEDYWLEHFWHRHGRELLGEKRSPIVVEVAAGPNYGREGRPEAYLRGDGTNYRLSIRRSPGSRLQYAAAGGRIVPQSPPSGNATYGTIGGFLEDAASGRLHAMTASHVSNGCGGFVSPTWLPGAASPMRAAVRAIVGAISPIAPHAYRPELCDFEDDSKPSVVQPNYCTAQNTPSTSGLDVALHAAAANRRSVANRIRSGKLADLSQGVPLTFVGATSGRQKVTISNYSVWQSYRLANGDQVCIHDCLQIKLPDRPYVRTNVSEGGDSGAWLLADGLAGPSWIGMLIGGDGDRAGIVPAERIVSHFEQQMRTQLVPAL